MTGVDAWRYLLTQREPSTWADFLDEHSGLPGPRGNIELALAFADVAVEEQIDAFAGSTDEYRAFCGTVGLAARAADPAIAARLHTLASDPRWRVREAVAIALQRLGDSDLGPLVAIVQTWADDPDPLVQRAAAAAICEPRLLTTPEAAAVAVDVCRRATARIAQTPAARRADPRLRTLRQGLGYCWSVAIAADVEPGMRAFRALDTSDPDVRWIVAQNLGKKRLARVLGPQPRRRPGSQES